MRRFILYIRKLLSRKLTLMLVPHHAVKPYHLHFTFSFALFFTFFWTGLTSWATWAVISNIDYWGMKVDHQILKLKVEYFAMELRKSREILDQVKEADIQLRKLLGMKSRSAILEDESLVNGQGGPTSTEHSILQKVLSKRLWDITDEEIRLESIAVERDSSEQIQSYKEISELIAYKRGLFRSTPQGWPTSGRITSPYGMRISPVRNRPEYHSGIDIAGELGTPVRSTADGVVELAKWEGGYGRLVILNHGFGYRTFYGHNSVLAVKSGERIRRGQIIAYMGSSGSSTGTHSHYEVWENGQSVNPWIYMSVRANNE